jgi:hypothetical protein
VAVQAYAYAFVSGQDRPKPDLWHWYRAVFANLAIFTLGRQHSSAGSNRGRNSAPFVSRLPPCSRAQWCRAGVALIEILLLDNLRPYLYAPP